MHKRIVFKRVLKFTLKLQQLQHVKTKYFNVVTLANSHSTLHDDGDHTGT